LSSRKPSVSAVSYLNTVPLVWGMLHGEDRADCNLSFAVPSECARQVESGEADLGIVPVAEMQRHGWNWIRGTGIAGRGAVRTILLISKVDPGRIRTLATDTGSRTSVQLSRVILKHRFGSEPELVAMAPDLDRMLSAADAALVIGDAALRIEPATLPHQALDLGQEWWNLTQLPMVFALWAGPQERLSELGEGRLETMFRRSLEFGVSRLDEIVKQESAARGFAESVVREYLTRFIRFEIGPAEVQGLETFLRYVAELDYADSLAER
jgi:predicted solute-binding protein